MTVYADETFLLNGAVDYLLLVCAAKLGGGRILRLRLAPCSKVREISFKTFVSPKFLPMPEASSNAIF